MKYLLLLLLQIVLHSVWPFCWMAYMGYKERMVMKMQQIRYCAQCCLISFIAFFLYTFYFTDLFPSFIAPIIGFALVMKFGKPVYDTFYRMDKH